MGTISYFLIVCGIGLIANTIHLWKIDNEIRMITDIICTDDESEGADG